MKLETGNEFMDVMGLLNKRNEEKGAQKQGSS